MRALSGAAIYWRQPGVGVEAFTILVGWDSHSIDIEQPSCNDTDVLSAFALIERMRQVLLPLSAQSGGVLAAGADQGDGALAPN